MTLREIASDLPCILRLDRVPRLDVRSKLPWEALMSINLGLVNLFKHQQVR
jgi:hypothetical protein